MGLFRTKKADRYTVHEARNNAMKALCDVCELLKSDRDPTVGEVEAKLFEWAEWRELQARKEGENKSDVR